MKLIQIGLVAVMALVAAGCETTSTNRINSATPYAADAGTGIVIFSTVSDGSEGYLSYTSGMNAGLYDSNSGCVRDIPNEERDRLIMWGGHLHSPLSILPVGTNNKWHVYELLPGDYVITSISRIRRMGNIVTNEGIQIVGAGPALTVREGQVTYAGDFRVSSDRDQLLKFLGHSVPAAQEYLAAFSNLPQEIEVEPFRAVPIRPNAQCNGLSAF